MAQPPAPSLAPRGEAPVLEEPGVAQDADMASTPSSAENAQDTLLEGSLVQGGLIFGRTQAGTVVRLDGQDVDVDENGNFIFGFNRDHGPTAVLEVTPPDNGLKDTRTLNIEQSSWRESRIQVEESKANPYKQADLDKIKADIDKKNTARQERADFAYWTSKFAWPVEGCISSPFGARRIVNGTPRRFHSGVDVAAPDGMSPLDYVGTEVRAPADGFVRLAEEDMFFEGGLIFIDHGQQLESALMHLSFVKAKEGDFVKKGDLVGAVGSTGRSTGPHLHWSLKWKDRLVNPVWVVDDKPFCTD